MAKFFGGVKGALADKLRGEMHGRIEKVQASVGNGKFDEALNLLAGIEKDLQKEVNAQKTSIAKEGESADKAAGDLKAKLERLKSEIDDADKRIAALDKEWSDTKGQKSGEKYDKYQERLQRLTKRIDEEKDKITTKKKKLAEDLNKANTTDAAEVKALLTRFLGLSKRVEDLSRAANPSVGKLADNPELAKAREDVRPGLEKMGEASQWLKKEHERTAGPDVATREEGHGSGRHGAQTGLDRGAARAGTKNDFRPDSPQNPDGVTRYKRTWNRVELEWEEKDGKRTLKDKKVFAQTVLTETYPDQPPAGTTAMFLNPILEKEAVDAALEQAKKCVWKFKANGNPLLELGIAVGKPKSAPGWGYSISKLPARRKNRERGRFAPEAVRRGHAHDR